MKKTISEYDYDDEASATGPNANNPFQDDDLYQSDTNETADDMNEAASEVTSSENDNAFSNQPNGDDDGESIVGGATVRSARATLSSDDDDQTSDDFDPNHKIKFNNKKGGGAGRQLKDDWNSGEDTNERYCICKDVSYGDMVMCDNSRVI